MADSSEIQATQVAESVLLGRYRLLLELGQGGTANVYLGAASGPSGFSKLVVLKVLKRELINEEDFRQMFLNEARLAARLNHPNVVQTNEVFEIDGRPVIVMEYLEGQSFSSILIRARKTGASVPLGVRLKIISEVLNGLHYAHELSDYDGSHFGVVHRDMTPHNIFVGYDGRVSILDFGIAKLRGNEHETRTGVIKGKVRFMPREQILGEEMDRRADLFAVGVMLWEAATDTKIWAGQSDVQILYNVVNNPIPAPKTVNPNVSDALDRICTKALAFQKEDRYTSAAELQADIDALIESDRVPTRALAKYVGSLFEDTREVTRKLIEQNLSSIKWNGAPTAFEEWAGATGPLSQTTQRAFSASSTGPTPTINTVTFVKSHRRSRSWLLLLLVLLGVGIWWRTRRTRDMGESADVGAPPLPTPIVAAPSPPAIAVPKQESPPPRQIHLTIKASPDNAQLYIDDRRLDANPYINTLTIDSAPHTIRATAQGFETESKIVTFENDVDVRLTLSRPKSPTHATPPPPSRAAASRESRPTAPIAGAPAAPAAAAPPAFAPNCNPPFTIDTEGIRRMKPECM